jgi:pyruvate/2-oxoglutarate dehydrogenase complex dihydrolipoamide dehydrogenase (E3) component
MSNCPTTNAEGKLVSWGDSAVTKEEEPGVPPMDEHNVKLLDAVQPRAWDSPDRGDDFVYDLIAIGAGAGGLVSAKQSARRGAKSALIEKHMAGGDCLNYGCVPSKALLRAAKVAKNIHHAATGAYGGNFEGGNTYKVDFPAVMQRMRKIRAQISPADACSTTASVGADIFNGHATFTGPHTLEVNGRTLKFAKAVIATGGRAFVPPIPGLAEAPHHTNYTLFNLTELPKRMVVVGAGPIGLEMAQAFANFGSEVTVLEMSPKPLPREDADAAKVIIASLEEDGVKFMVNIKFLRVDHEGGVSKVVTEHEGVEKIFEADCLLIATGRR